MNPSAQIGFHALGQPLDQLAQTRLLHTIPKFLLVPIFEARRDILCYCGIQQRVLLQHSSKQTIVFVPVELSDVLTIQQYSTFSRIIQTTQQLDQRGFTCAVQANNGDFLAGADAQIDVMQRILLSTKL